MSPSAGTLLVEEIAPRLRAAIPKSVRPVGAEDAEELVQDAITFAAQMLHRVEASGKTVTPGNIAYYAILHMRSGRRSHTAGRSDVMSAGTQLDAKSCLLSMEEEVGYDPELDEPITLGSLLASDQDDPGQKSARNIDWEVFLATHDYRYGIVVKSLAEGQNLKVTAERSAHSYSSLYALKEKLAEDLREYLGATAIGDSVAIPRWKASIAVDHEKAACKADRRRN